MGSKRQATLMCQSLHHTDAFGDAWLPQHYYYCCCDLLSKYVFSCFKTYLFIYLLNFKNNLAIYLFGASGHQTPCNIQMNQNKSATPAPK